MNGIQCMIPKLQAEKPDCHGKASSALCQIMLDFLYSEVALSWSINLAIDAIKFCIFCDITKQDLTNFF